jgi:hypothetical protein
MNIKAHFEQETRSHEEIVAEANRDMETVKNEFTLNTKENSKLDVEKRKLEDLLEKNEKAGLGVTELREKIQDLDSRVSKITRRQRALQEREQKCAAIVRRSFDRENLMVSVLEKAYRCSEANIVDCLDACLISLPVRVTQSDNWGHPLECNIQLGPGESKALKIKPGTKHFWIHFHPVSLQWLPTLNKFEDGEQPPEEGNGQMQVFFDSKSDRLILPMPLKWCSTVKVQSQQWHEPATERTLHYEDKFDDVAVCVESSLDSLIETAGGVLDLDGLYSDNPVMAHLRDRVVLQTNSEPKFKKTDERHPSGQIYDRIQNEWDAFVRCPWTEKITGTLALLKYLVENGEKVRFWSGEFENQFGLRIRTRDHDWIVGEIFIEPSATAAAANTPTNVYEVRENSVIARFGRLSIHVERETEDRI